jgi:isopenicillin-N N-acyltransferase like protein
VAATREAIVECRGDGRERGRAHGEALREEIHELLERWDADAADRVGRPAPEYVSALVGSTGFAAAIGRHTPGLLDEVRGIAEGAGVAFERVLALNLMDEEWWFAGADGEYDACSLAAVDRGDGRPPLLAQNMDLPVALDGAQTVLRLEDGRGWSAAVLSAAGLIGLAGVNGNGLGVCVNALGMLNHSADGLPVAFVVRGLLERPDAARAAAFLRGVPHASGQHYALADPSGVSGYECSAAGAVPVPAVGGRLLHTNHPLRSRDVDPGCPDPDGSADSHARMRRIAAADVRLDSTGDCEALLADRETPLCVLPDPLRPWITFGSIAAELSRPPSVRIALGPPDRAPWLDIETGAARAAAGGGE